MKYYYVYILASTRRALYIGITSNFEKRLISHRWRADPESFTAQYNVNRLVYYEEYTNVKEAIQREKQLKTWNRSKKVALIETLNPDWKDFAEGMPMRARDGSVSPQ